MKAKKRDRAELSQGPAGTCPVTGALSSALSAVASNPVTSAQTDVSRFNLLRIVYYWIKARGNFSEAIRQTLAALGRRSFSLKLGEFRALFTVDPNLVHQVMVRQPENFPKTQWERRVLEPVMEGGLIILEDEHWQHDRRILAGCFGRDFLAKLPGITRESCQLRMRMWSGGEIDISHEMRCIVNDIIRRYFLSQASDDADEFSRLLERAEQDLEARVFDPFRMRERYREWRDPNWKLNAVMDRIAATLAEPVHAERETPSGQAHPLSYLVQKLEDPMAIVQEVRTLSAASLTSGHLLSWISHLLAQNPDVQRRLRDEIKRHPASDSLADIEGMRYLTAVVNEGLRLFPPAPFLLRTARGSNERQLIFIPVWAMHRDPEYWPEPTRFMPERWLDKDDIENDMFIPFGLGARVCIGRRFAMVEVRVILRELVRRFWLEPVPGYQSYPKMDILTRPRWNMRILLTPAGL